MNIHSPAEVIEMMCLLTHDANDIRIEVVYETINIIAVGKQNCNFRMSWEYVRYGNEHVRQIAQDYYLMLDKAVNEENKPY